MIQFLRAAARRRVPALAAILSVLSSQAPAQSVVVGNVRVQLLSDSLVRLEWKGAGGFEDRQTFHIVNRDWPGTSFTLQTNSGAIEIHAAHFTVRVPQDAVSLDDVSISSANGEPLYQHTGDLTNSVWLPAPSEKVQAWSFADTPRIVPPERGLTPGPDKDDPAAGWDLSNRAPDLYVFLPRGDYFQLRADILKLTGPTELPPLFMFGAFDSRWYDYSEATALKQIQDYRSRKIPLDVLVVDTGWRQGASTGYSANTNLFPNLPRFFSEAHAAHVRVLFNDHPEPLNTNVTGLDPAEMNYRFNGLSTLLHDGLDIWWYDRNWWVALVPPAPGLRKETWGMRLYHDTTARVEPDRRPLIMANVDGIDNGIRNRPMDVSSHRYPYQWTGDIGPGWEFLRRAVENAVYSGAQSAFPYESDDLGGHTSNPTTEQYIRWMEYGALSPVYRPHCTHNLERMPWVFGPEAETDVRNYLDMRYRLLPVFYAAAHENYETGQPLLRRLDLYFPQYPEAGRDDEYLLGKDILVAPVLQGSMQGVPSDWLKTTNGQTGLQGDYFTNDTVSGTAAFSRTDTNIDFNWDKKSPAPDFPRTHFSARWAGTIEVPASVGDITLATLEDDGALVWIDGRQVIEAWGGHDSTITEANAVLTAGVPHQIRIEYQQLEFGAKIRLLWQSSQTSLGRRIAWIPPGNWMDAWNGKTISGPATLTNDVPLDEIPLYIRSGAILPLAPEMQFTGQKPWNPITLDTYPTAETNTATLYEDDTLTTAYQHGAFRTTEISASADNSPATVRVDIGAARGTFDGALAKRNWIIRIHPPASWPKNLKPSSLKINGRPVRLFNWPIRSLARAQMAMPFGDHLGAPDGDVFEVWVPAVPASRSQSIEVTFNSSQSVD